MILRLSSIFRLATIHQGARYAVLRAPAMSMTTPAATMIPPMAGGRVLLLWVVTPIVVAPILALWVSLLGTGTKKARIPNINTTIPATTSDRTASSVRAKYATTLSHCSGNSLEKISCEVVYGRFWGGLRLIP